MKDAALPTETPLQTDSKGRPTEFRMEIQGSLLEALGVNLYSNIGKCLVEFAANAHDSDSPSIHLQIPFESIARERTILRDEAKAANAAKQKSSKRPLVVHKPLPEDVQIKIIDKGHGMTAEEIQNKFLPLNRNRREGANEEQSEKLRFTESGKRLVMGRKGLGKLAAFGVAQRVSIRSKRKGETYASEFTMDYDDIRHAPHLQRVPFKSCYHDNLPAEDQGTTITLSCLRCDAVAAGKETIESIIGDNFFGIDPKDFSITINTDSLAEVPVEYEFHYPESRPHDGLADLPVEIPGDLGALNVRIHAMFRARREKETTSLSGTRRGVRFYCNNRLAAGPSLLNLHTGVHNFQATAYLECIVQADELDALGVDLINTNRTDFRRDNEIVDALLSEVTAFLQKALSAHSKFRDAQAEKDLNESDAMKEMEPMLDQLSKDSKKAAKNLLKLFAKHEDPKGENFKTIAPLLIGSINSGSVLVKLLEMSQRDTNLKEIIQELQKLAAIEQRDALKLFRARKNGIIALQGLIKKGDDTWKKSPQFENEIHSLLEKNPWIISEEKGRYLTSDQSMAHILKRLDDILKINKSADPNEPDRRPDLVFLLCDSEAPNRIDVVELKSPNLPLKAEHMTQLEGYIVDIEKFFEEEIKRPVIVRGYLIGTIASSESKNREETTLAKKWKEQSAKHPGQVAIITLQQLADQALSTHQEALRILEKTDSN